LCDRSLQVADALDDAAVRARTFNLMGIVDRRRGDSSAAIRRFEQSLAQYEALGNVYGQATSHNLIANGLYMEGRWTESDEHYRQSLQMFTQIGDRYDQVLVNNNLGGIALKQGRLDAALAYYEKAVRLLEQSGGSLWVLGALHMNTANALIQRRELDSAGQRLQLAQDYFDRAQLRDLLPEMYGLLAEAAWLQGDLDDAKAHGQHSLDLARELEMPREEGHNLRILGEIVRAQGAEDSAEAHFQDALTISQNAGDEYEAAKIQLSLADLYTAHGRTDAAGQMLDNCEAAFDHFGARLDLEKTQTLRQQISPG
jgi:tetratricopeptide (TPR) repeat protein